MTLTLPMEKSKKFNSEMQKFDYKLQVTRNYKFDRLTLLNSTNCGASIFTDKTFLSLTSSSIPKFNSGSSMAGKQPRNKQNYNPNRCFSAGLGSYCQKISVGGLFNGIFKN